MDEAALRALVAKWRNNSASQFKVSENEGRPVGVRSAHWGGANAFKQCAEQLEALLQPRSTEESER